MTDKKLEFKHAHITGQAMRDHWGPIVDRIAAETADWRDEWIYDLITENERLRGERTAIVAWLRHRLDDWPDYVAPSDIATAIEAGEHLK